MTWRERLAAAWDYPRLREELAETRKELADSQAKCAQLEDTCLQFEKLCDDLSDTAQRHSDMLAHTRKRMAAIQSALLSFCPELNTTEQLCQFYNCIAPEFDPDGFRLYFAAQEISGIRNLYECFPYEDARGCFEAVSWEVVPGTTYERAVLQEVDTSAAEYQAFERQFYAKALERMGFQEFLPVEPGKAQEQAQRREEGR